MTTQTHRASTQITVAISPGPGFLRGEVYNDSTGLPLPSAMVTLLADGRGPLTPPLVVTAPFSNSSAWLMQPHGNRAYRACGLALVGHDCRR